MRRALVTAVALSLASCGGSSPEPDAGPASTLPSLASPGLTQTTVAPEAAARLPDVTVDDVGGGTVRLASLTPAALPTLIWFWAPH